MTVDRPPAWPKPATYHGVRMRTKLVTQAARILDTFRIPWLYRPPEYPAGRVPDFRLWPKGRHPWFLEVKEPFDLDVHELDVILRKLDTIRLREPDSVLLLWQIEPDRRHRGDLAVNVPGGGWVHREAAEFMAAVAPICNDHLIPVPTTSPWWRRWLRR